MTALRAGELVGFPTETVYGLGADATNAAAVARVFALKGRPADHPLIVHLAGIESLSWWAATVPPVALALARQFWPGPLTLIVPKAAHVLALVTGGQDSVGLRVPAHPVAQRLLTAFGGGIAAPSANRYGRLSPTRADHVRDEFGAALGALLDGGEAQLGLESTIVACLGDTVRLLRPGVITRSQIEAVAGPLSAGGAVPRASGDRAKHYAPQTPLELLPTAALEARAAALAGPDHRLAVLAMRPPRVALPEVTWIDAGDRPDDYGHSLYNHLRSLDRGGFVRILVETPPDTESWAAVRDRLQRASAATT